jgi:hypothetical protein
MEKRNAQGQVSVMLRLKEGRAREWRKLDDRSINPIKYSGFRIAMYFALRSGSLPRSDAVRSMAC